MTHPHITQSWLDRWFRIAVIFKGLDGVLELIGGTILLFVPAARLHTFIIQLGHTHLVTSHDLLGRAVASFGHTFTSGVQIYTAIYLLLHGVIKVGLVIALLSRRYSLYPAAIIVLVLFMGYQIYRIIFEHSIVFDSLLTAIDALVVWLTILEYLRHTSHKRLPLS